MKTIIKKGIGYWETTRHPIGGEFHRATEDIEIEIIRTFDMYKGCNCEGITKDDRKIATDRYI